METQRGQNTDRTDLPPTKSRNIFSMAHLITPVEKKVANYSCCVDLMPAFTYTYTYATHTLEIILIVGLMNTINEQINAVSSHLVTQKNGC